MKGFTMCEFTRQELEVIALSLEARVTYAKRHIRTNREYLDIVKGNTTAEFNYRSNVNYWTKERDIAIALRDKFKELKDRTPLVLDTNGPRVSIELQTSIPNYDGPILP